MFCNSWCNGYDNYSSDNWGNSFGGGSLAAYIPVTVSYNITPRGGLVTTTGSNGNNGNGNNSNNCCCRCCRG